MSSNGYGRGRGFIPRSLPTDNDAVPLAKGRQANSSRDHQLNGLSICSKQVVTPPPLNKSLNLHTFGESLLSMKEEDSLFPLIVNIVNSPSCTEDIVKRMIEIIIDRCMWLPIISRKYASLLTFLTSHTIFGETVRVSTYNALEEFYVKRVELCKSKKYGDNTLHNSVILLGEIYYRYRIQNSRIKILSEGLITYLKMLAISEQDIDLQVLTEQISWSGHEVVKTNEADLNELMIIVRTKLSVKSTSYTDFGRTCLLMCLDLHRYTFDGLPDYLVKFYKANLGETSFNFIKPPSLEVDDHVEYYNSIRKFFK